MRISLAAKRAASGLLGVFSWAALLAKAALGAIGDFQTITGIGEAGVALLGVLQATPYWLLIVTAVASTGTLLYSLIVESAETSRQLRAIKDSNDRAWAFSAQFHGFQDQHANDLEQIRQEIANLHTAVMNKSGQIDSRIEDLAHRFGTVANDILMYKGRHDRIERQIEQLPDTVNSWVMMWASEGRITKFVMLQIMGAYCRTLREHGLEDQAKVVESLLRSHLSTGS